MLEERNERGCDRHDLLGRYVHELHLIRWLLNVFFSISSDNGVRRDLAVGIERRIGLRDDVFVFAVGRKVADLVGHDTVLDDAIRRLDETETVDAGIGRKRRSEE